MRLVSDFALAAICIWAEARGEPYAGQIAVGEVIRNRAKTWNRSVTAVIFQPLAFSWANAHDPNRIPAFQIDDTDAMVKQCVDAWLASEKSALTGGALNYWNPKTASPSWAHLIVDPIRIGHHLFGTPPDETKTT